MNTESLTEKRQKLLDKIVRNLAPNPDVLGIFLGGSLAVGNADEFSDVDFRVVVRENVEKSDFLSNFIRTCENLAFIETQAESYAVLHFDSFVKLDVFIYHQKELAPSIWLQKIKILKDDGFLSNLTAQSAPLTYQLTQAEFDEVLAKFYAWFHELYRRNARGEQNYTELCSLMLKNIWANFCYMSRGLQSNSLGDWSKLEGKRSKLTEAEQAFLTKHTPVKNVENFMTELSDLTHTILKKITEKYTVKFDESQFVDLTRFEK
ncbi:nucleotidyltransferase domain-containing protein [Lactococcus cremoris]|uniref:Polymerase nucleotidyl transferase domain-containing protein n=1 Tax=Lactococcus cremoris subsp. tructae TaxID=542833 RepID=A0A2A5SPM6_LACLC|nr:nucleotidyltransferase domain-containing protein [Lactococcus cremoris]PCS15867.1 hypothetical protein RU92_GL001195 [Lactococcus cremoris subsp. tructae]